MISKKAWIGIGIISSIPVILGITIATSFIITKVRKQNIDEEKEARRKKISKIIKATIGEKDGVFYKMKIPYNDEKGSTKLNNFRFDSGSTFFAIETYTKHTRWDKNGSAIIESLANSVVSDSNYKFHVKVNSLYKAFLKEKNIVNTNFQKIDSVEKLNQAFPKEFFTYLQGKKFKHYNEEVVEVLDLIGLDYWKNMLKTIKNKYNVTYFKNNDLLIVKGLTAWYPSLTITHTPTIDSISIDDEAINIKIEYGKMDIGYGPAPDAIWQGSTIHFTEIPKGTPENFKISSIYTNLNKKHNIKRRKSEWTYSNMES